jgi:hypothetical protein
MLEEFEKSGLHFVEWGVTAWKSWSRGKAEKFFRKPLDPDAAS